MNKKMPDIVDVIEHREKVWTRGYGIDYELADPIEEAERIARKGRRKKKRGQGNSRS